MKAIVLLSGGVDSATCLGLAVHDLGADNVTAVSVSYGQKHSKELECAKLLAQHYEIKHEVIDLSAIYSHSNCSLLSHSTNEVPEGEYSEQKDRAANGMVSTYVPFRNGLMLSAVAALAVSIYPDNEVKIYIGAHADDAAGSAYADCSPKFTAAMEAAIEVGTYRKVHVYAPFVNYNKAEVVAEGIKLKVPYEYTWSCYNGDDVPCGKCGTCIDRAKAFAANGIDDPALAKPSDESDTCLTLFDEEEEGTWVVSKTMEIAGAHHLSLPYDSKCTNLHGHNWQVTVTCRADKLNDEGMVIDFAHIKHYIQDQLDHKYLNDLFDFNPTAENMAKWICNEIDIHVPNGRCVRVDVEESRNNIASYIRPFSDK